MPLLSHKSVLAIVAVTDVALNSRDHPVAARALCARLHLPPRCLEDLLQALVREGILKAIRGPRGGYELAREPRRITTDDILRAVRTVDGYIEKPVFDSLLIKKVVSPALAKAENVFSKALARISVQDLTRSATALKVSK